jgi:hypothetical protein
MAMRAGTRVIQALAERLPLVRQTWSEEGLSWRPYGQRQTIEVAESFEHEGVAFDHVRIRTEVARVGRIGEDGWRAVNDQWMSLATLAGPVLTGRDGRIELVSSVVVSDESVPWVPHLLANAALAQLEEAWRIAWGEEASRWRALGFRPLGDRWIPKGYGPPETIRAGFIAYGLGTSAWSEEEFEKLADNVRLLAPNMGLCVASNHHLLVADLPCVPGGADACLLMSRVIEHPHYASGLACELRLPIEGIEAKAAYCLALTLNRVHLMGRPQGYGLGSFAYLHDELRFRSFYPNAAYRPGFAENVVLGFRHIAYCTGAWLLSEARRWQAEEAQRRRVDVAEGRP